MLSIEHNLPVSAGILGDRGNCEYWNVYSNGRVANSNSPLGFSLQVHHLYGSVEAGKPIVLIGVSLLDI